MQRNDTHASSTRRERGDTASRAVQLAVLLLAVAAPRALGENVQYDLDNCNATHPCCIDANNVSFYLGPLTKTWCNIEYPVRTTSPWNSRTARILDIKAQKSLEQLQERGCLYEECKGFVCAEYFPRCFWIDDTTQGSFVFETCRETCEACYSTCTTDESPKCGGNPSQYEIACTSGGSTLVFSRLLLGFIVALCLRTVTM
uniref:ShKT domain-containing protein n=1 Tax=Hemiselmis andersenii TaxID=464988 RepID=A0A6T8GQP3_HEMAN